MNIEQHAPQHAFSLCVLDRFRVIKSMKDAMDTVWREGGRKRDVGRTE